MIEALHNTLDWKVFIQGDVISLSTSLWWTGRYLGLDYLLPSTEAFAIIGLVSGIVLLIKSGNQSVT